MADLNSGMPTSVLHTSVKNVGKKKTRLEAWVFTLNICPFQAGGILESINRGINTAGAAISSLYTTYETAPYNLQTTIRDEDNVSSASISALWAVTAPHRRTVRRGLGNVWNAVAELYKSVLWAIPHRSSKLGNLKYVQTLRESIKKVHESLVESNLFR